MGRKLAMRGAADRRGDEHPKKITRERQMHNKEEEETPSHLMRFVDLIFLHLPCGGVVCGQRTRLKTSFSSGVFL
jgi:hypothetical protein